MTCLNVTCWNCSGIYGNYVYARNLLKSTDILAISEHWLYNDDLSFLDGLDENFCYYASSSYLNDDLRRWKRGQGGVGLLWRKELKVRKLFATDRIIAIKTKLGPSRWTMICSVYLPSTNRSITEFKDALDALELFCLRERGDDDLIILGDFNAHVSGTRYSCRENTRGRYVKELLQKLDLTAINLLPSCLGPSYTYESSSAHTTVDYICLNSSLLRLMVRSEVIGIHPHNVTHHLPVQATIQFSCGSDLSGVAENETRSRIAWKKCTNIHFERFQCYLNRELNSTQESDGEIVSTEEYFQFILKSLDIASKTLPRIRYKSYIKPYWNNNLTVLKKMVSEKYKLWLNAGKPRGRDHQTFADYKEAKRLFRKEQRCCAAEFAAKEYEELASADEQNYDRFWSLINLRKRHKQSVPILEVDGQIFDKPRNIAEKWADYFEKLHTPGADADADVTREVYAIAERQNDYDDILDTPILMSELKHVIRTLPNGKTPGSDGICYEHVKWGGDTLQYHMLLLFNAIMTEEQIPESFKIAIKIPIPKGRKKQARGFDEHRGISLLPVFDKILQRLILNRIQMRPSTPIHFLQGAYQKGQDALTTAFMIDETIKNCCEQGDRVHACFVDISKAFDQMWIDAMLYKLYHDAKIKGKCWRIISNWYLNMKEFVYINGTHSRTYNLLQGTRQGGILSPWLFLVYINDLISGLENKCWGVFLYHTFYGAPMFADDLTVLSRLKTGLDRLLSCLHDYATKWRIVFNIKKTVILVFGEKTVNSASARIWSLGDVLLNEKEVWKNLGKIWHIDSNCKEPVQESIHKGFEVISRLASIGCRSGGLNPKVSARLWKVIALPHMLYGCELWYLKAQQFKDLEKVLNVFCRAVQSLIPGSSGSAARGLLGLHSIKAEICKRKLYLLGRIINSDSSLAYRKLFMRRLIKWKWNNNAMTGFIPDIIKIVQEFDLFDYIADFLINGNFPSKRRWKDIVKSAVYGKDQNDWVDKINKKSELKFFLPCHPLIGTSKWYELWYYSPSHSKKITDVIRLLCGSLTVKNDRFGNAGTLAATCSACGNNFTNPIHHALLFCRKTEHARENWWLWITDHLPISISHIFNSLDDHSFIKTLLGNHSVFSTIDRNSLTKEFGLQCATYISYCVQNSTFDPFKNN